MADTIAQVIKRIQDRIRANDSDINTQPASVIYDSFIDPLAAEIVRQGIINDYTSTLQSLDAILDLQNNSDSLTLIATAKGVTTDDILSETSAMIDALGSNYNMYRNSPIAASGYVLFIRDTDLAPGEDVTLTAGISVKTDTNISFVTTETVRVNAALGTLQPYGFKFAVAVNVSAVNTGVSGNVLEQSVTTLVGTAPSFNAVTNPDPMGGGTDAETDAQFVARIKLAWQGNNVGTRTGYERLVLGFGPITDVVVVGAGDDLMIRDNGYGGAVDIYILEQKLRQVTETISSIPTSGLIPLTRQPVRSIVSPTNFDVELDPPGYRGSIQGHGVAKKISGSYPATPFQITYVYNAQVEEIQARLTESEIALDNDVLIKEALEVQVDMTFRIRISPGYNFASVKTVVTTNLTAYMNDLKIGDPVQTSDVVNVVLDTAGVDQMALPPSVFNRQDAITATPPVLYSDNVVAGANEYLRLGTLTITQM